MTGAIHDQDLRPRPPSRLAWAPAVLIGLVSLLISVAAEAGPGHASIAAGVFPPWWSQASSLSAAGRVGEIAAVGALPFIIVVQTRQGAVAPRLQAAGALFSLRAGLAGRCGA